MRNRPRDDVVGSLRAMRVLLMRVRSMRVLLMREQRVLLTRL